MAKKLIKESKDTQVENNELKPVKTNTISVEDLVKQLKEKEQLKTVIETQYSQLCGQIQLLAQMINSLQEKR